MSTVHIRFASLGSDAPRRSPLLEGLLARAGPAHRTGDWRREAFGAVAPGVEMPPIAGAALAAAGGTPGQWGCIASPVHCVAGMTAVTLPRNGCLTLEAGEAAALAADFNRTFGPAGPRLIAGRTGALLCTFPQALEAIAHDPAQVAGNDVFGFQPAGPDGATLRRLMSEMEMWLFEHGINRTRATAGRLPVTGLWLWGGGAVPPAPPMFPGWTAGRDALFAAYGDAAEFPSPAASGVLVSDDVPGSETWLAIERRWLEPIAAALGSRRLERLELSSGDRCFGVAAGPAWRIWRRRRPWWEYFDG